MGTEIIIIIIDFVNKTTHLENHDPSHAKLCLFSPVHKSLKKLHAHYTWRGDNVFFGMPPI